MNGSMASDAPEKNGDDFFTVATVQRMLPLVERIVQDILAGQKHIEGLALEQGRLERNRRQLLWPQRQRRYQLNDELTVAERELQAAMLELQVLGVALLDPEVGRIGFPTVVDQRRAFFSWKPGEKGLHSWHFAEETACRPIPPSWLKGMKSVRQ